ncbi:MAG: TonB-dependent receptor [Gemmatimonadales bacterium]|nr:MAG: TonB-dependent receptor [Gemmatimonadales bacterium]
MRSSPGRVSPLKAQATEPDSTSIRGGGKMNRAISRALLTIAVIVPLNVAAPTSVAAALSVASPILIQEAPQEKPDSTSVDSIPTFILNPINVTATRSLKQLFFTAAPVSVVGSDRIVAERPNNAAEMIRRIPGVDVNGVGANQQRPIIRGQRGQRILLLEDGLRMNNARRQADFGELPSIVDVNQLDRIEVVRGPASVLYGSDAIGGVVNMISSETPVLSEGDVIGGSANFSYRTAGEQLWPAIDVFGRQGKVGYRASASFRDTEDYRSASGTFGDVTLENDVTVSGSGVRDQNYSFLVDYAVGEYQKVYAKFDYYKAEDAGFGFVANEDLGLDGGVAINIQYPDQTVTKLKAGYQALGINLPFADRIDASLFFMDNERDFIFDVNIPFGSPGTGVFVNQQNFTDLQTFGLRLETAKLFGGKHVLTYGLDYYHDDSENTDRSETVVIPFPGAPVNPMADDTPTIPFSTYDKFGVFAQADLEISDRAALIVGARWQNFKATPQATPGLDELPGTASENTVVVAANGLVKIAPNLNLVGTVGRGFRAPNLVELFFNGAAPEGNGFQIANPDLEPETSWNVDAGLKYRRSNGAVEAFYFRTRLEDGIRISATGDSVGPFPAFQSINVDKLILKGIELLAEVQPVESVTLGATYTWLDGDDEENDQNNPTSETYSSRITGEATYRQPSGRWWAQVQIRHNGEQKDAESVTGSLVGEVLPSFTVMHARAGVKLFDHGRMSHSIVLGVENLTDQLYAEFSNATFFRPAPKRTLLVSWATSF